MTKDNPNIMQMPGVIGNLGTAPPCSSPKYCASANDQKTQLMPTNKGLKPSGRLESTRWIRHVWSVVCNTQIDHHQMSDYSQIIYGLLEK